MLNLPDVMDGSKPVILLLGEIVLAHKEWDSLRAIAQLRQLSEGSRDQFLRDLKDGVYDGVVAISRTWDSTEITGRFDQTLVDLLPKTLKFISHNGAGYDSIDAIACAARGISVSNTPGAVDASTATVAIWLMLGALRRAHIPYSATRSGNWRGRMKLTHDPENKMLGILGMGGIGTAVAKRAIAFGMSIQYHNRHELSEEKNPVGAKYVGFEELLRTSDVISVHLPLNEGTRGMLGKKEFAMMKDGVVLVNTARGPIVDEATLVEELESGKVWGAGLDVYEKEPVVHEGLLENDHCVLMPHVGTASFETQYKMENLVIKNLRSAITKGKFMTPVAESKTITTNNTPNGVQESENKKDTANLPQPPASTKSTPAPAPDPKADPPLPTTTTTTTNGTHPPPRSDLTTASSTSTLGSPAIPILDAINPEEDPSPPSSYAPSNPGDFDLKHSSTNTSINTSIDTKSASLWTAPPADEAAAKKKEYNWLELSPPLKGRDKDVPPLLPAAKESGGIGAENGVKSEGQVNGVGAGGL